MKAPPSYAVAMQHQNDGGAASTIPTSSSDNISPPSYTQAISIQENTHATPTSRQQPQQQQQQQQNEESSST